MQFADWAVKARTVYDPQPRSNRLFIIIIIIVTVKFIIIIIVVTVKCQYPTHCLDYLVDKI